MWVLQTSLVCFHLEILKNDDCPSQDEISFPNLDIGYTLCFAVVLNFVWQIKIHIGTIFDLFEGKRWKKKWVYRVRNYWGFHRRELGGVERAWESFPCKLDAVKQANLSYVSRLFTSHKKHQLGPAYSPSSASNTYLKPNDWLSSLGTIKIFSIHLKSFFSKQFPSLFNQLLLCTHRLLPLKILCLLSAFLFFKFFKPHRLLAFALLETSRRTRKPISAQFLENLSRKIFIPTSSLIFYERDF